MTIVAIATYPGRSALGTLRISGPTTLNLLKTFIRSGATVPDFAGKPRHLFYATLHDTNGSAIDDVTAVYFRGPASYTGEDSAEITLHGNPVLLRSVLHTLCGVEGVRPAEPGEFTSRAFRNGKMDLTKAESVARLIEARSDFEVSAARTMHSGELLRRMSKFRADLIGLKAETEAEVDFSTEDLTFQTREARERTVGNLIAEIEWLLLRGSATGRIREGVRVALVGVPNSGKSSLLNRLLGYDRAIVTPVPGTTRDTLSEELQLAGIPVRLVDTAGIRETEDEVEREGVRRSIREIEQSTLILHVIDGSRPPYDPAADLNRPNVIHVLNKTDHRHPEARSGEGWIEISCKTGEGIHALEQAIQAIVLSAPEAREPLLLEDRHRFHLSKMRDSLTKIIELWRQNAPDEITALELDDVLEHAGKITGKITNEEILGRIFSTFCVGK